MDTSVILSATSGIFNYPAILWSTLVASFGTIPALIISGFIVIGIITVTRTSISYLSRKIRGLFCKKEVSLLPQTMG